MVYLCQHKIRYLFLVVKVISFDLLDFFPYSVKEGEENKNGLPPFLHSSYWESEKGSLLGKALSVTSVPHSGARHRSRYYMHFPSI